MKNVRLHWKQVKKLDKAIDQGFFDFAIYLDDIIKKKEVVPKDTGALENSQTFTSKSIGDKFSEVQISYDVPYARRLYFNDLDLNISQKKNKNARERWLEDVLFNKKNEYLLAQCIRMHLGDFTNLKAYQWSEDDIPSEDKPAPVKSGNNIPGMVKPKTSGGSGAGKVRMSPFAMMRSGNGD